VNKVVHTISVFSVVVFNRLLFTTGVLVCTDHVQWRSSYIVVARSICAWSVLCPTVSYSSLWTRRSDTHEMLLALLPRRRYCQQQQPSRP